MLIHRSMRAMLSIDGAVKTLCTFAEMMLVELAVAVGVSRTDFLNIGGKIIKALGPQEEAVAAGNFVFAEHQLPWQRVVVRVLGLEHGVPRAALGVEAFGHGDGF